MVKPRRSHDELKALWREYFGVEPPAYRRGFLVRGIAHRLQELTYRPLAPAYQGRLDAMIAGTEKSNGTSRRAAAAARRSPARRHSAAARVAGRDPRGDGDRWRLRAPGQALPQPLSGGQGDHPRPMVGAVVLRPAQDREQRMSRHSAKPKVRCAIYCRKSSEEGLELAFNSLDAQREACAAYIDSQRHEGWLALDDRYDDGGCHLGAPSVAASHPRY
jgi:hypothetical protein